MKKIVRLTERDLTKIVKRVINEGVGFGEPIANFPDGIYKLTKVEGDSPVGTYLQKTGASMSIYTGNYEIKNGGFYGGGTIYK